MNVTRESHSTGMSVKILKKAKRTAAVKSQPPGVTAVRKVPARRARAGTADIELVPALLKLKTILAPVDFSEPSKDALRYAALFARQFGAKLVVISVVEPVVYPDFAYFPLSMESDEVVKSVQAKLEALCLRQRLDAALIEKVLVRVGNPFQEICAAAQGLKVDLIILATHGRTGFKRAWLGSTAERVVRHASCPVLVVRQREGGRSQRAGREGRVETKL
jgi:nucleotide-binding universal stress UspA family protein